MTKKYKLRNNLRFRLAVLYSAIFFVFSGLIVLTFNIYINIYTSNMPEGREHFRPPPVSEAYSDELSPFFQENKDFYEREFERMLNEANYERLKNFQFISMLLLFPLAIISFLLGYVVSGYFMSPLRKLSKKIEKVKSENLGVQLEQHSDDEIGQLIRSFNIMSARLKVAFDSQSEFVQNAAHELKTPLTIIQTNLDTALQRKNITLKSYETAIKRSLVGMEKINNLTDSLLTLAAPIGDNFRNMDFVALVNEQLDTLKKNKVNNKIKIQLDMPKAEVFLNADKYSLGRAVYNIIENALKYSAEDKLPTVKIFLYVIGDKVVLKVKNNGAQIPAEERGNVFDRFYRLDKSRNRKQGGYGLGLAIVKKIIDDHQGKIFVEADKAYTCFVMELKKAIGANS